MAFLMVSFSVPTINDKEKFVKVRGIDTDKTVFYLVNEKNYLLTFQTNPVSTTDPQLMLCIDIIYTRLMEIKAQLGVDLHTHIMCQSSWVDSITEGCALDSKTIQDVARKLLADRLGGNND